jgi:hypothetical protein
MAIFMVNDHPLSLMGWLVGHFGGIAGPIFVVMAPHMDSRQLSPDCRR